MQKLSARVTVLEAELSEIRLLLERQTGVLVDASSDKLCEAVSAHVEKRRLSSAQELLEVLRSSDEDSDSLAEHLLDGQTAFFCYPEAFEFLAQVALPEMQSRKPGEN